MTDIKDIYPVIPIFKIQLKIIVFVNIPLVLVSSTNIYVSREIVQHIKPI